MFIKRKSSTVFVCIVAILVIVCMSFSIGYAESAYTDFALTSGIHFDDDLESVLSILKSVYGSSRQANDNCVQSTHKVAGIPNCIDNYHFIDNKLVERRISLPCGTGQHYIPWKVNVSFPELVDLLQALHAIGGGTSADQCYIDAMSDYQSIEALLSEMYGPESMLYAPNLSDDFIFFQSFLDADEYPAEYNPMTVRVIEYADNTVVQIVHTIVSVKKPSDNSTNTEPTYFHYFNHFLDYRILSTEDLMYTSSGV